MTDIQCMICGKEMGGGARALTYPLSEQNSNFSIILIVAILV